MRLALKFGSANNTMTALPDSLQEIADTISLDVALRLAQSKGGQRISIPAKMHKDHWLAELLGFEDAQKLSHFFTHEGRIHFDVPYGPTSTAAIREARIARMVRDGCSANEITYAMKISRRTAFYKKQRYGTGSNIIPDHDQFDFFKEK